MVKKVVRMYHHHHYHVRNLQLMMFAVGSAVVKVTCGTDMASSALLLLLRNDTNCQI